MEVLLALCFTTMGILLGGIAVDVYTRFRIHKELIKRTETLNINIDSFSKAYGDFNARALELESRFSTLEFKLTGITGKL